MDDLRFRKTVLADPFTSDPEIIQAAKEESDKRKFWDEVKAMEYGLQDAMKVPIPENLAEKLILRQSLSSHEEARSKRPWYLALAASALVASVLTVGVLNSGKSTLASDVFAHLNHVNFEIMKSGNFDLNELNTKLASFNGEVIGDLGDIVSANYCYLDKIKSLHLIVRGENGLTSLFVVPDSISDSIGDSFSNGSFIGSAFLLESAKIIVAGENKNDVESLKSLAREALAFSA